MCSARSTCCSCRPCRPSTRWSRCWPIRSSSTAGSAPTPTSSTCSTSAGLALPASLRPDGIPFGVTVLAPGGSDALLASLGRVFHADTKLPLGATGESQPPLAPSSAAPAPGEIAIAVVGAHMSGMPLNGELKSLGARFLESAATAPALPAVRAQRQAAGAAGHAARRAGRRVDCAGNLGAAGGGLRPLRRRDPGAALDRHAGAGRRANRERLSGRSRRA